MIQKISRDELIKKCKSCADKIPHLHFYTSVKAKKFETFGDCIVDTRNQMVEWSDSADDQDFHSFTGGKSRKEFLSTENVRRAAKNAWEQDRCELEADRVICKCLDEPHIDGIVNQDNFKGFIDNG